MFKRKLNIPIFDLTLNVIVADSIEEYADKHNIEFSTTHAEAITFTHDNQFNVLFVSTDVDVIAHEVIHIKNMIFDHVHIKLDTGNDEFEAYLTGWLVKQIHGIINR